MDWSSIIICIFTVVFILVVLYLFKRRFDRELGEPAWVSWILAVIALVLFVIIFGGAAIHKFM